MQKPPGRCIYSYLLDVAICSSMDTCVRTYHIALYTTRYGRGLSQENQTPIFSSPGPNILKYLDPRIIYFNFAETFGPPGTKNSEIFRPS